MAMITAGADTRYRCPRSACRSAEVWLEELGRGLVRLNCSTCGNQSVPIRPRRARRVSRDPFPRGPAPWAR